MEITPDTKIVGSCAFISGMQDVVFITDGVNQLVGKGF